MLDSSLVVVLLVRCLFCWRGDADGGVVVVVVGVDDFRFCCCFNFGTANEIDFGAGLFRFATNFVDAVLVVLSEFDDGVNI